MTSGICDLLMTEIFLVFWFWLCNVRLICNNTHPNETWNKLLSIHVFLLVFFCEILFVLFIAKADYAWACRLTSSFSIGYFFAKSFKIALLQVHSVGQNLIMIPNLTVLQSLLSLVTRKPVFGVSDQGSNRPATQNSVFNKFYFYNGDYIGLCMCNNF